MMGATFDVSLFAVDLRVWRARQSISLGDVAKRVGSSVASISRLENGLHVPYAGLFLALCHEMDADPMAYRLALSEARR